MISSPRHVRAQEHQLPIPLCHDVKIRSNHEVPVSLFSQVAGAVFSASLAHMGQSNTFVESLAIHSYKYRFSPRFCHVFIDIAANHHMYPYSDDEVQVQVATYERSTPNACRNGVRRHRKVLCCPQCHAQRTILGHLFGCRSSRKVIACKFTRSN